jgi:dihydrolipoamide dehydrogenase
MAEDHYDLVVIGAGPGGYVAAARGAQSGMRVACVDKEFLGGTCLNVGCIPSKALLESSELYHQLKSGLDHHGIHAGSVDLDLGAMMSRKEQIVQTMTKGIGGLFGQHGVDFVAGEASIQGAGTVQVVGETDSRTLSCERILLATGSAPIELPDLPFDGAHVLSSTEALSLGSVPQRMVVVGAGAIGLELGSVWNRLGTEVLVVEFMDHILPGTDRETSTLLQRLLKRQGLEFRLQSSARHAVVKDGKVVLTVAGENGETEEECDCVLVAVGRRPFSAGLGLEVAGIEIDEKGVVRVDENYQTNVDGIFAIGDLISGPMLAHKAEEEAVAAVERMVGSAGHVNYNAIPNVVYTHPELASVGLTEEAAIEAGITFKSGKYLFRANARAHCMDMIDGHVKIIGDANTDRLLGMHIVGPQASHLIAEGALAIEFASSVEDLARSVHAHPTLSEVIKEAAWTLQE